METGARYDSVADFYETENPDSYTAAPDIALLELVAPVNGLRLLDAACGHGRISRELARRGATVSGLDLSAALLAKAQTIENQTPLGIDYVHADVASPQTLDNRLFDAAVCHFGLSDIDDLDGALATVTRVLRPAGTFVLSILHPCFPGWGIDVSASWPPGGGYYQEGWWATTAAGSTLRQQVGANHRTLSTYLNALTRHGLAVERITEPPPPPSWTEAAPHKDPVPVFLVVRCRKR